MSREDLARRQAALVAALVTSLPMPEGFDEPRVRVAAAALMRKRASEVAAAWPALRVSFGPRWNDAFATWAAGRPPNGALRDGWDFARSRAADLGQSAAIELAQREVALRYDALSTPRRRRAPALRRTSGGAVIQLFGRVHTRTRRTPP
jgi:hypothetical protein